jgi:hypothetical protein
VIELYEEGVYYEVDLKTKVCKKGQLQHPWVPHNVGAFLRQGHPWTCGALAGSTRRCHYFFLQHDPPTEPLTHTHRAQLHLPW